MSQYAKYANYVPVLSAPSKAAAPLAHDTLGTIDGCSKMDQQEREQQQQKQFQLARQQTGSGDTSRTSLLGRPLKVETHHRDLRYRKKQNIIYNFLERPRGWKAAIYHFIL